MPPQLKFHIQFTKAPKFDPHPPAVGMQPKQCLFNTRTRAKSKPVVRGQSSRPEVKVQGQRSKPEAKVQSPGPDQRPEFKVQEPEIKGRVKAKGSKGEAIGHGLKNKVQRPRVRPEGQTRGQRSRFKPRDHRP